MSCLLKIHSTLFNYNEMDKDIIDFITPYKKFFDIKTDRHTIHEFRDESIISERKELIKFSKEIL